MLGNHEHAFWIWQPCWMFTRILQEGSLLFSCNFPRNENRKFDISHHDLQMPWLFFVKSPDTHTQIIFQAYSAYQRMYTISKCNVNILYIYTWQYKGFYVTTHVKWCNVIHPFSYSHHQIYFYKQVASKNLNHRRIFVMRALYRAALLPAMAVKLDLKNIIFWLNPGWKIGILTMVL